MESYNGYGPVLRLITYNINYSRRATGAFESYSLENREKDIFKVIKKTQPTIILLQEVFNKTSLMKKFKDYEWVFESDVSRPICCNAIGVNRHFLIGKECRIFTFNYSFIEKSAEKALGIIIDKTAIVNVHFPMTTEGRFAMAEHFTECFPKDSTFTKIIIAGDFNSFPDLRGAEQMEIIKKMTGTEIVSDNAKSMKTFGFALKSFYPYPYDEVPEETLKIPGKLDHILVKGYTCHEIYVLDDEKVEGKDFAPSDHFPIYAILY